jgi:hypothetical protein
MSARKMDGPLLTNWAVGRIGEYTHLVGFFLGGHGAARR